MTESFIHISASDPYKKFFLECMLENRPALLDIPVTTWPCYDAWRDHATNQFSITRFCEMYKDLTAPVYDCSKTYFNSHVCEDMKLSEFSRIYDQGKRYLKDWHLYRHDQHFYSVPVYFQSDWLNEYCDSLGLDDYRFVYAGGAATFTPYHRDVLSSYSWSANVLGKKRWLFVQPGGETEKALLSSSSGDLPHDISTVVAVDAADDVIAIEQASGNAIFVPSDWHHQVENVVDTVSCNHNWINGCNILKVWEHLRAEQRRCEHSIAEHRDTMEDFDQHVQTMLRALAGMNFADLEKMLREIVRVREARLGKCETLSEADILAEIRATRGCDFVPGCKLHDMFDLARAKSVLNLIHATF